MSRAWEAPRTAYELAAEWAGQLQDLAAHRGGAGGQDPAPPPVGKAWHDLRLVERRDVLDALAIQARGAMWELREAVQRFGMKLAIEDHPGYMDRVCEQAAEALEALAAPAGREWKMPGCPHCQEVIAQALIHIQYSAIKALGAPDPAEVLRVMAGQLQPPPGSPG